MLSARADFLKLFIPATIFQKEFYNLLCLSVLPFWTVNLTRKLLSVFKNYMIIINVYKLIFLIHMENYVINLEWKFNFDEI